MNFISRLFEHLSEEKSIHLLEKYNREIKYLLCANNLVSKNGWVIPLKTFLYFRREHAKPENQTKNLLKKTSYLMNVFVTFKVFHKHKYY